MSAFSGLTVREQRLRSDASQKRVDSNERGPLGVGTGEGGRRSRMRASLDRRQASVLFSLVFRSISSFEDLAFARGTLRVAATDLRAAGRVPAERERCISVASFSFASTSFFSNFDVVALFSFELSLRSAGAEGKKKEREKGRKGGRLLSLSRTSPSLLLSFRSS